MLRPLFFLILSLTLFGTLLLNGNASLAQELQQKDSLTSLQLGQSAERTIAGGEIHRYSIRLKKDEYVTINFSSFPLSLIVELFAPGGHQIQQEWRLEGDNTPLFLAFFAEEEGVYEIRLSLGIPTAAAGKYQLHLQAPFTASQVLQEQAKLLEVTQWINRNAVAITSLEPESGVRDLKKLKKVLADVRIVGLGEATHGSSEFFKLKHRLLEYLVTDMGFTHFAIEGSQSAARAVNEYVLLGKGSSSDALSGMGFWQWDTKEVAALIEWMRLYNSTAKRKIQFIGFDFQVNKPAADELIYFLHQVAPEKAGWVNKMIDPLIAPVDPAKPSYVKYYTFSKEKKDSLIQQVRMVGEYLDQNRAHFIEKTSVVSLEAALQNLHLLDQFAITYNTPGFDIKDPTSGIAVRDRFMAENLLHALTTAGQNSKIVLWSHNEHIKRDAYNMGYYLHKHLGKAYYAMGFGFNEGSFQAMAISSKGLEPVREITVGPAFQNSVDWYLKRSGKGNVYIDFRKASKTAVVQEWLTTDLDMRSIGNAFPTENPCGYFRSPVKLQNCYDGLLYIEKVTRAQPNSLPAH